MTAKSDETALKPCPFCGGVARLREDVSHSKAYFVGCSTEDCFGELHWGQSKAETVVAWNTRTAPTTPAGLLAELKAALRVIASPPRVDISDSEFLAELVRPSARKLLARLEKEVKW